MREFSKISPAVWHSSRFNSLPSDDGRYLYLYLLSSPHQTSAGACHLPEGYALADLNWLAERYRNALQELIKADLIEFDPEAEVVVVKRWFRHNPPMNEKHLRGIVRLLERLPSQTIRSVTLDAAQEAWKSSQRHSQANSTTSRVETRYLNGGR